MTTSRRLSLTAALGAAVLLPVLLTGCGGGSAQPAPTATGNAVSPTAAATPAAPTPSATATAGAAEASCEDLIGSDILADLKAQNWTYKEDVFAVAGETLEGGITCTWADYSVASGNLLLFGWAPITAEEADAAVSRLESQGWTREEAAEGYYVTEDATQSPTTDEDGYGMTYEFGDGWVTVADTKQGLLLIQRPAS